MVRLTVRLHRPGSSSRERKENIMSSILSFIRNFPLLTYFVLTFAISWGCILIFVSPGNLPITDDQAETVMPLLYVALLAGPSIAGMLLIGIVHGRAGHRDLLSR